MSNTFEIDPDLVDEIDDAEPLIVAPKGTYSLKITDWLADEKGNTIREDKNGLPFCMPVLSIFGTDNDDKYKTLNLFIPLPSGKVKDAKKRNARFVQFKKICTAFSWDFKDEFNVRERMGSDCEAILDVKNGGQYGDQNEITSFV